VAVAAKHAAESVITMPPAGLRRNPALTAFKSPCSADFPHRQGQKRAKFTRFACPASKPAREKMVYMRTIVSFAIVHRSIDLPAGSNW
jgi:hypothetical protein